MSTESRRIRVLLADDHSIVREGLESMLKDSEEFEVVGSARDGVEAVRAALRTVARRYRHGRHDAREGRGGGVPGDHGVCARRCGWSC